MSAPPKRRAVPRRWCLAPALLRQPGETLEAATILNEVEGPAGLLLWQSLRDVTLWADLPPARRRGLFTPRAQEERLRLLAGAPHDPELQVALTGLATLLEHPEDAGGRTLPLLCLAVARWAEHHGHPRTALAFAQAAALASGPDAATALAVGRASRRAREYVRAESWLRRAILLGRRAEQWEAYAGAHTELGTMYAERGVPVAARPAFVRAFLSARRAGLPTARGDALHGLLRLALDAGEVDEAERLAPLAIRAYRKTGAQRPPLVRDLARLWMLKGEWERASTALSDLLPTLRQPQERMLTAALLALAAAAAGETLLYQEAWSQAWALVRQATPGDAAGEALVQLSEAAAMRADLPRIDAAARHALSSPTSPGRRYADQIRRLASARARPPHPARASVPSTPMEAT